MPHHRKVEAMMTNRTRSVLALVSMLSACAGVPTGPPSTPYKGAAVWNIARTSPQATPDPSVARSRVDAAKSL
jgi:hypothetical protein